MINNRDLIRNSDVESIEIIKRQSTAQPLVSIMIPTFRRPHLLKEAIASALRQNTNIPYEVIVIDNEQDSYYAKQVDDVVKSFKSPIISLYRNEKNIGMFGNWNRSIDLANAEWITILNDDDILHPDYLENVWKEKRGISLIGVRYKQFGMVKDYSSLLIRVIGIFYRTLKRLYYFFKKKKKIKLYDLLYGQPFMGSLGVLFNKHQAIRIGCFNESWSPTSDYVFIVKYCLSAEGYIINKYLVQYRWAENETLKLSTRIDFIKNDFILRTNIVNIFFKSSIVKKIFGAVFTIHTLIHVMILLKRSKNALERDLVSKELHVTCNCYKYVPLIFLSIGNRIVKLMYIFLCIMLHRDSYTAKDITSRLNELITIKATSKNS